MSKSFGAAGSPVNSSGGCRASSKSRSTNRVPFTCGGCGRESSVPAASKSRPTWAGLCVPCVRRRFSRKFTADEMHPSGTVIHFAEREGGNLNRVAITCHRCSRKSFNWFSWVKDPRWRGLCNACTSELGKESPQKVVQDEKLPSGSTIHWSGRGDKYVPVTCALGSHRWDCSLNVIRTLRYKYKRQGQAWPGYCPTHRRNTAALTALLIEQAQQRAFSATAGTQKRGRKSGTHGFDHAGFLTEVNAFIFEMWNQYKSFRTITREAVAAKFQAKGEQLSGTSIKNRLRICGITTAWPVYCETILRAAGDN